MEHLPHQHPNASPPEPALEHEASALLAKEKYRRNFRRGMRCIGIGCILLVLSFLVNLVLFGTDVDFKFAMYSMTTLGSGLLLVGMAFVFGV